jgi:hypothetical protein
MLAKLEADLCDLLSGGLPSDAALAEYASAYAFDVVTLMRLLHMRWFRMPGKPAAFPIIETMQDSNLRVWLETEAVTKYGTLDQQQRYVAGHLPQDELLALARSELFRSIETTVGRWVPLKYTSVHHVGDCRAQVEFASQVLYPGGGELMGTSERNAAKSLDVMLGITAAHPWLMRQELAKPTATVFEHTAACVSCSASTKKYSARVSIPWAGRTLTREYSLSR